MLRNSLFLALLVIALTGCQPAPNPWPAIHQGALLIDVRPQAYYDKGHIEGAINVPCKSIEKGAGVPAATDQALVIYCRSGLNAQRCVRILRQRGYTNVIYGGTFQSLKRLRPAPVE